MDPETLLIFQVGSTGHAHLFDDQYIKVTELMARLIKVLSHWIVGDSAIAI